MSAMRNRFPKRSKKRPLLQRKVPSRGLPCEVGNTTLHTREVTMHSGMPTPCDPSHPHPLKRDGVIAAFLADAAPPPATTSLVTTETSVRIDSDRWMHERGSAE